MSPHTPADRGRIASDRDGVSLSWVDCTAGLPQYERELLPRLRAAGWRT